MSKEWNYYLEALRNTFNYKDSASGEELRWFFVFMLFGGFLFSLFLFIVRIAVMGEDATFSIISTYSIASIYFIINAFPLCSLVKRRFNRIAPLKTQFSFYGWLVILAIFLICQIVLSFCSAQVKNIDFTVELIGYLLILSILYIVTIYLLFAIVFYLCCPEKPAA